MENVGFIGLGIMGKPMAHNLLKAGVDLTVCDLNQDAVNELVAAGAKSGSYKEIGESCDIILTILPNGAIVQSVLFGEGGVAEALHALVELGRAEHVDATRARKRRHRVDLRGTPHALVPVRRDREAALRVQTVVRTPENRLDLGLLAGFRGGLWQGRF